MFTKHAYNMTNTDSYIRTFIVFLLLLLAYKFDSIILYVFAFIILSTAITKFCLTYYIFDFNKKFSIDNYYLSLLPKYISTPVFIGNEKGIFLFRNSTAKEELSFIENIKDFYDKDILRIIENNLKVIDYFEDSDVMYQVEIQGIKKEKLILIYFYDVSKLMQLQKEIEETQKEVIYALGEIGEALSDETSSHVKRVSLYSYTLARLLNLPKEESELLQIAASMHDIGKIGISQEILNAPRKLSNEELKIAQQHTEIGYNMLKHSDKKILKTAAMVARDHHEKYDGTGYPKQLKGDEIHIFARIVAIADVFDTLSSQRIYKKPWEVHDIVNYFKEEKGKHFDPHLVALFLDNLEDFLAIKETYSD